MSLAISLWIAFVCDHYFFLIISWQHLLPQDIISFIVCQCSLGGGLVYLYRNEIKSICEKYSGIVLFACIAISIIWYFIPYKYKNIFYIGTLMLYCLWLSYAIGSNSKFLLSKPMRFISSISMEMYLAQMVVFRVVEKLRLLYLFGNTGMEGMDELYFCIRLNCFRTDCFY